MQVVVYQMRKNGVDVPRDLLSDEARNIGELCIGVIEELDSIYRRYHHHDFTFGMIYAFSEAFVPPIRGESRHCQ